MEVVTVGVNHHTASPHQLAGYALNEEGVRAYLARLTQRFREALVLSTCGRTEVTVATSHPPQAMSWVIRLHPDSDYETRRGEVPEGFFQLEGRAAVSHLFEVAAGLDSMLIGEREILGQVRRAAAISRSEGAFGPVLDRAVKAAVAAARRIRRETGIEVTDSFTSVLPELARAQLGELADKRLLLIGAGQAAKAVLQAFLQNPLAETVIANRTSWRAAQLAERFGALAIPMHEVPERTQRSHIVVLATGAKDRFCNLKIDGTDWPGVLFDLGPSSPAPRRPTAPNDQIRIWRLKEIYEAMSSRRGDVRKSVAHAHEILDEEVSNLLAWWSRQETVPVVKALIRHFEDVRDEKLQETLSRLGGLSQSERDAVAQMTSALVRKLLHTPISMINGPGGPRAGRAAIELFNLNLEEPNGETCSQGIGREAEAVLIKDLDDH